MLVITGDSSAESEQRCFDYGVNDFIHKPFERTLVTRRVGNMIALYKYNPRKYSKKQAVPPVRAKGTSKYSRSWKQGIAGTFSSYHRPNMWIEKLE